MKTVIDIYNEMWFTYHWSSPYNYTFDTDIHLMILESIDSFANNGEYH